MNIFDKILKMGTSEEEIISNKKEGKVYVADFASKEGKYISCVFNDESEQYDASIQISPKVEVRITYITNEQKITGVQITKISGKNTEKINLSTLGFEGILNLLHIFSNLDLSSIAHKSIILDASLIDDEPAFRKQINTILADEKGKKILEEMAATAESKSVESIVEVLDILNKAEKIDPKIVAVILKKLTEEEKIDEILSSLSELELKNLSASHRQRLYKSELDNLKELLSFEESGDIVKQTQANPELAKYSAGQPEKIFQNWIESNLWIFGTEYIKKHDARKIAIFSEGDLLMESMDGFLDLIELKRPKLDYEIFNYDKSHKCFYPSPDLSKVIGQCLFYLQKLDEYKLILEKEYKCKIIRPQIKIIIGRSDKFGDEELNALRMLNSNLNHIQVVTYDYLLDSGIKIISNYQ